MYYQYRRMTPYEKELKKYNKSSLKFTHFYRIVSKQNRHFNEVLHLMYYGRFVKKGYDKDRDFDLKKLELASRINLLLQSVELKGLAFSQATSWENDIVEVAITEYGKDAILVILEVKEIHLLIFENNYQNKEEILKKYKEGFYNAKLYSCCLFMKNFGNTKIYEV